MDVDHGTRHAPRGSDPATTDAWREVADAGTAWSGATAYTAGDTVDNDSFQYECIVANTNVEPGVDSVWVGYWHLQASIFVTGSNASPTIDIPNPVPLRYRLSTGPPNVLDIDGTILVYTRHQIEIQGDVTGLSAGDTVFMLPAEYQHDFDVPYHTHDDSGVYVPCRLLSTGEFIWGTP